MIPVSPVILLCLQQALLQAAAAFAPPGLAVVNKGAPLNMGVLSRFRNKKKVEAPELISVGSLLPEIDVQLVADGDGESVAITIQEVLGDGTSLLVGMPGAFTPTCSTEHLPGYVFMAPKFRSLGVKKIVVVTTNDQWVNNAWKKDNGLRDDTVSEITVVSDGDGELVRAMGLIDDMGFGVGVRSKRFAMIVKDGKVASLNIDEGLDSCERTSATSMVEVLAPGSSTADAIEVNAGAVVFLVALGLLAAYIFAGGGEVGTLTGGLL